jgi:hypothetical protein
MKLESHLRAKASLITYSNNSYSNTAVATGDFFKEIYRWEQFPCLLEWKLQINIQACIKAMKFCIV